MDATASAPHEEHTLALEGLSLIQNAAEQLVIEHQRLTIRIGVGDRLHIGAEVAIEILESIAWNGHNDFFYAGGLFERFDALVQLGRPPLEDVEIGVNQ